MYLDKLEYKIFWTEW